MIEAWGRGIELIIEACREAGTPEPEVKYEQTGLWLVFQLGVRQAATTVEMGGTTQETTKETTKEKILALLSAQPASTREELAAKIGLSADGIKYHLQKMRSAGLIRHVGSTKAGHWEVSK